MGELATTDTASDSPPPQPEPALPPPGIVDVAAMTAVVAVLVAISMRRSLGLANADSLLYGLISTEELTFYYWGQDRLANLVPAIAWPVQQIEWNYLLQTAILASSFFVLIGCFVWFHATRAGRPTSWPVVITGTAISGALTLVLLTPSAVYDFVLVQQYAFSMLLFLVGMWWLTGRTVPGRAVGALGILASVLVIAPTVALVPFAAVIRGGPGALKRVTAVFATSLVAFVIGMIMPRVIYDGTTNAEYYEDFSIDRLGNGLGRTLEGIADSIQFWPTLFVGAVCATDLVVRRKRFDPSLRWTYVLSTVIAIVWVVLFSANRWVEINDFRFRYHFTAYAAGFFIVAGTVAELVSAATDRRRKSVDADRAATARAVPLVVPAAALVIAATVALAARLEIPAIEEGEVDAVVAQQYDVELVVGDYWRVWPAMFADRANGGDLLAVSVRSDPLADRIREIGTSSASVGVLCVDDDPPACLGTIEMITGGGWRIVSTTSERPLVIEVVPT